MALEVQSVPVDELAPYENNAKIHTAEQVAQICASIREFGFNDPIAVWGSEIVEGHGRLLAARELGMSEVPVIRLDHLTDEQRRAYTHVHNQLTMNTGFDFATLDEELANLDFEWEEFGFDVVPLDGLDDVLSGDFVSLKDRSEQLYFDITLTFEAEHRDTVLPFLKAVGREGIKDMVIREAEEWA